MTEANAITLFLRALHVSLLAAIRRTRRGWRFKVNIASDGHMFIYQVGFPHESILAEIHRSFSNSDMISCYSRLTYRLPSREYAIDDPQLLDHIEYWLAEAEVIPHRRNSSRGRKYNILTMEAR